MRARVRRVFVLDEDDENDGGDDDDDQDGGGNKDDSDASGDDDDGDNGCVMEAVILVMHDTDRADAGLRHTLACKPMLLIRGSGPSYSFAMRSPYRAMRLLCDVLY
eukprot:3644746-Rhodomonas_salina.1